MGVARSTYYRLRDRQQSSSSPDPLEAVVCRVFKENNGAYGARRIKKVLNRRSIVISRKRIVRILKKNNLASVYTNCNKPKDYVSCPDNLYPNILNRVFDGYKPYTHIAGDLTYVKLGNRWSYICLLVDLYSREIVGHSAGFHKDAKLVKAAFAIIPFELDTIKVFHTDRGSEFNNMEIDDLLRTYQIERSVSRIGNPYDNAVVESTNKILRFEFLNKNTFVDLSDLHHRLNSYVAWYNNERLHSHLGYLSPREYSQIYSRHLAIAGSSS